MISYTFIRSLNGSCESVDFARTSEGENNQAHQSPSHTYCSIL